MSHSTASPEARSARLDHRAASATAAFQTIDVVASGSDPRAGRIALTAAGASARRAVSCLVEPQAGDTVLVAAQADQLYVLAVLVRPGLGDAVLSLPDPAATMQLRAQSVTLTATAMMRLEAPEMSFASASVRLVADALTWLGRRCTLIGERLVTSVRHNDTIAERVSTKAMSRLSIVEGLDSEKLGSKVSSIDTVASATSQASLTAAREDLRFDAKRISLG